ncbi:hypothetical protein FF2_002265 [Malus domestica]
MDTKKPTVRIRMAPRGTYMGLEMIMIGVKMTRPRTMAVTVRLTEDDDMLFNYLAIPALHNFFLRVSGCL